MRAFVGRGRPTLLLSAGLLVSALAALSIACSDDAPDPFALAPCDELPAATLSAAPRLTMEELAPALRDAATRLVLALPEGELRQDLRSTMQSLSAAPGSRDTACRLFLLSREGLDRLGGEEDPASAPDRTAIGLVLEVTRTALEGS